MRHRERNPARQATQLFTSLARRHLEKPLNASSFEESSVRARQRDGGRPHSSSRLKGALPSRAVFVPIRRSLFEGAGARRAARSQAAPSASPATRSPPSGRDGQLSRLRDAAQRTA
eukprot:364455-Chlamydomonas_euryale.AAC.5